MARLDPTSFGRGLARRSLLLASLLAMLCGGCAAKDSDGLGRFLVEAERGESCGDGGVLGTVAKESFSVHLRIVTATVLHWREGSDVRVLDYAPDDGSFSGRTFLQADLSGPDGSAGDCVVEREDEISGTLFMDSATTASGFEATSRYDYEAVAGSNCAAALAGPDGVSAALPCTIAYTLSAEALD